jgi:hypothetical protein
MSRQMHRGERAVLPMGEEEKGRRGDPGPRKRRSKVSWIAKVSDKNGNGL